MATFTPDLRIISPSPEQLSEAAIFYATFF